MTLFTKTDCHKCEWLKKEVDLEKLGVKIEILTPQNHEALAHLAWHELVAKAEKSLPILVLDDGSYVTGAIKIKRYLKGLK